MNLIYHLLQFSQCTAQMGRQGLSLTNGTKGHEASAALPLCRCICLSQRCGYGNCENLFSTGPSRCAWTTPPLLIDVASSGECSKRSPDGCVLNCLIHTATPLRLILHRARFSSHGRATLEPLVHHWFNPCTATLSRSSACQALSS